MPFLKQNQLSVPFTIGALLVIQLTLAQTHYYPLVRTAQNVSVQRTLPKGILPPRVAMPASFSKVPTDEEIFRVHFFEEPLIPASKISPVQGESVEFLYALAGYSQRKSPDDFSSLTNFLKDFPNSRWAGSLLASLGIVYRRTGYFSQAMDAWQQSWTLLKNDTDPKVKVLADRVVSELLLMYAWVGRADKIDALFTEIDQRSIEGPAVAQVIAMRSAIWTMKTNPGISFKCGPYALNELYMLKNKSHSFSEKMIDIQSPNTGFSLSELQKMSNDIGLNYQMAFREPGSAVIAHSVVHWKLGHYSALLSIDSGNIQCQDATSGTRYGDEFWLTTTALDSSASGYFLVPRGTLPKGWHAIGASEGRNIFGKGYQLADPGKHVTKDDSTSCTSCDCKPMAQSDVHLGAVSLHIFDNPLYYDPPVGPSVDFTIDYHRRDTYQPSNYNISSMGPKWTFKWLSFVKDNPGNPSAGADVYIMRGGDRTFTGYDSKTKSYAPETQTSDVLVKACDNCYELRHPDGSKEVYARPDGNTSAGRMIFLTEMVDFAGNKVQLFYDSLLRITAIQDAIKQVTTIYYENAANKYQITKVVDPFNRSTSFGYDSKGRLITITDMIGIISSFHYDSGDFIDQMTTPYGTTSFVEEDGNNDFMVETHYPMGEKERVQYIQSAPNIKMTESVHPLNGWNDLLIYRNTFFWSKKAMQEAPGDYTKAKIYHWLHGSSASAYNANNPIAPILESIKNPLENRVWYSYQGQGSGKNSVFNTPGMLGSKPSIIGRVLEDGSSQYITNTYNALGKVTKSIDPLGRTLTYSYDTTLINLLEVRQTTKDANELLGKYTYNSQNLPLSSTDASGMTTTFSYNSQGQITIVTNAKKETTTFTYDSSGYLQNITGPVSGATFSFSYDVFGRVRSVTDQKGYTITTDYDALDRPTVITYPDSTYRQVVYDRLDAVMSRDRMGRWDSTAYDSLDRPVALQDALGRITKLVWCNCGSLAQIIDPLNNITTYTRDIEGRVTQKTYNDGKSISYQYENTSSRLKEITDAKGQKSNYKYYIDNNLDSIIYSNSAIATPSVSFTYDPAYNRVATMTDATGTTTYTYNPVLSTPILGSGQLAAVSGQYANSLISYNYDSLGRQTRRIINGEASSVVYDSLGRITENDNILGKFSYQYIEHSQRISTKKMPNHLNTFLSYYDNEDDRRLKEILNSSVYGNTLSKFGYAYNTQAQITKWTQQSGNTAPRVYDFTYDAVDQLSSVKEEDRRLNISVEKYHYIYDSVGNTLINYESDKGFSSQHNSLNQLTAKQELDQATHSTNIHLPGSLPTNRFTSNYSYDDNGNMLSSTSPAITYGWDAADRLVSVTQGNNITGFIYDGLGRRIKETLNGITIKMWLWDGMEIVEEHDAEGNVTKRFFSQGEQINGNKYYFSWDHLRSVRDVTDSIGVRVASYDYDPYGKRKQVFGNIVADFGFTGHYYHAASGLYLATYRAYNPDLGRWINRDPVGESSGVNVYDYAKNNPLNNTDPLGLSWYDSWIVKKIFTGDGNISDENWHDLLKETGRYLKCNSPVRGGFVFIGLGGSKKGVGGEGIFFEGWDFEDGWNLGYIVGGTGDHKGFEGTIGREEVWSQNNGHQTGAIVIIGKGVGGGFSNTMGNSGFFLGFGKKYFGGFGVDIDFQRLKQFNSLQRWKDLIDGTLDDDCSCH